MNNNTNLKKIIVDRSDRVLLADAYKELQISKSKKKKKRKEKLWYI